MICTQFESDAIVPHFYFDVHDGVTVLDETGRELPGCDAARLEAMKVAAEFVAHTKMLGTNGGAIVVVVRDGPDHTLFEMRLVFNFDEK